MDQHPWNVKLPAPSTLPEFVREIVYKGPDAFTGERRPHWSRLGYRLARELRAAGWTQDQVELMLTHCKWVRTPRHDEFAFVVAHKTFVESPYEADWQFADPAKFRHKKQARVPAR